MMASSCLILTFSVFYFYTFTLSSLNAFSSQQTKENRQFGFLKGNKLKTIAQMSDGIEYDRFKNEILTPFLIPRVSDTDGNRVVQKHITDNLEKIGWTVENDSFVDLTPFGNKTFTNIIGNFNAKAGKVLTLACHFDSKYFEEFTFIGATDSAVPCAILIDIAQKLTPLMEKTKSYELSLQLIFFDGEEAFVDWTDTDSLYGSRHLANKWVKELFEVEREVLLPRIQTIDLFVLLDLIGSKDTIFKQQFSATKRSYQRLQNIESKLSSNNLLNGSRKILTSASGGQINDDHHPFLYNGVPVVHLISNPFPSVWHEESDNEANLNHDVINNVNKIVRIFVVEYLNLKP